MFEQALTVSQYGTFIKNIFEAEVMLHGVSVFGEISGWQVVRDNAYFNLKDENACISCVMFGVGLFNSFKDGDSVIVTGSPNYYVKGGKLSFNVFKIEKKGLGTLYENLIKLKQKLEDEGLFDSKIKKSLPKRIKKIGIVTSSTGAVLHDIMQVCSRRNPFLNLVLYPVKVQGDGADAQIARGILFFNQTDVDVVIVARGGGSQEDLSCFNTEKVARAGFSLEKPLISAVGHETDFTIIDFVADVRAATPSVAGELVSKNIFAVRDFANKSFFKLSKTLFNMITINCKSLEFKTGNVKSLVMGLFNLQVNKNVFYKQKLVSVFSSFLLQKQHRASYNELKIQKLNPKQILSLGYAKVEQSGENVKSLKELKSNLEFELYFEDGKTVAKQI